MKVHYFINKHAQETGEHEVHREDCTWLPEDENRLYLGMFNNCIDPVKKSSHYYPMVDGCYYCCRPCHKR